MFRSVFVLFVLFVPFVARSSCAFLWLLLDRYPNRVAAAVEECCPQQPRPLSVAAKCLGVHVEVPLSAGESELISGGGCISRRSVDR